MNTETQSLKLWSSDQLQASVLESEVTFIGQGTRLRGEFVFDRFTRILGEIEGKVQGLPGSLIVVGETATIHGEIHASELIIDGFVKGNVFAKEKVTLSETATLMGDIESPDLEIRFGAFFEGKAKVTRPAN